MHYRSLVCDRHLSVRCQHAAGIYQHCSTVLVSQHTLAAVSPWEFLENGTVTSGGQSHRITLHWRDYSSRIYHTLVTTQHTQAPQPVNLPVLNMCQIAYNSTATRQVLSLHSEGTQIISPSQPALYESCDSSKQLSTEWQENVDQGFGGPVEALLSVKGNDEIKVPCSPAAAVPEAELWQYLAQHGRSTLAISSLQQGMQHFVLPCVGYIAYGLTSKNALGKQHAVALGDPICAQQQYGPMAAAFLQAFPTATFMMASESFAKVLSTEQGMLVNSIGGETELDLATYQFTGAAKRGLRSAISGATKSGVQVTEVMQAPLLADRTPCKDAAAVPSSSDVSTVAAEMAELDQAWINKKGKNSGDVWFINRAAVHRPETGVRKFVARDAAGQLQAYMFFDAVYEGGAVVGYYANVTRMRPGAHPGVLNLLVKEFIDRVRAENNVAAPARKVSVRRSQRKKMQQQPQQQQQQQQLLQEQKQEQDASSCEAIATTLKENSSPSSSSSSSSSSRSSNGATSGVRFLSLGLSPLYAMDVSLFPHSYAAHKLFTYAFKHGSRLYPYPFQSLAAAKAKYGAGGCSAVSYKQAYMVHNFTSTPAMVNAAVELFQFCGFYKSLPDAVVTSMGYTLKGAGRKAKRGIAKGKKVARTKASKMVTAVTAGRQKRSKPAGQCASSS